MDPFGDDDLFEVFDNTDNVADYSKLQLKKRSIDEISDILEPEESAKRLKNDTNESTQDADDLKNNTTVRTISVNKSDDYFLEYKEQLVEGSAKPIKPSTSTEKTCAKQICYPPDYDKDDPANAPPPRPSQPAKTYPFTLDPFQAEAVDCIERNESVLVSAHTSAGKTVVAEYAIALSLKRKQRVIYTSPIKALSNQKFRELQEEFHDVGLMTGDVTINASASCLVMTTEILRNMLYRGSEVIREIAWVIFDEIHYMRDRSRGVVWEETIILLPPQARMVFLSATIPNAAEFALWVAKLHSHPCTVVYTDYRPTPLQHYVFPANGKGLFNVLEGNGTFNDVNYQTALSVLTDKDKTLDNSDVKKKKVGTKASSEDVSKIVKLVMDKNLDPCIVFSFSKKDCENYAKELKNDFCSPEEKSLINQIFHNAIEALTDDDKNLPQVQQVLPLLRCGIGVHHGGLLPILKEVTEILFQEGLLKVLFSTETFAMGLNMPARTVVFTSVSKFDGVIARNITSGEYIQMSGRAGRRGLDDRGIVILMLNDPMEPAAAKAMITGAADPLLSSFHLGYNMLLNLLRVEGADPEYIMIRSFYQFQQQRAVPQIQTEIQSLTDQENQIIVPRHSEVAQYHALTKDLSDLLYQERQILCLEENILKFIKYGRIIKIRGLMRKIKVFLEEIKPADQDLQQKPGFDDEIDWGFGLVLASFEGSLPPSVLHGALTEVPPFVPSEIELKKDHNAQVIKVLVAVDASSLPNDFELSLEHYTVLPQTLRPHIPGTTEPKYIIMTLLPTAVEYVCEICIKVPPKISTVLQLTEVSRPLGEVVRRKVTNPLNRNTYNIQTDSFKNLIARINRVENEITKHTIHGWPEKENALAIYSNKIGLQKRVEFLKRKLISVSQDAGLKETLHSMKRVLRLLGLTTNQDVITPKGRVACEISTCDELISTELIYTGAFNELTESQTCALMSCLIFDESTEENKNKTSPGLERAYKNMKEIAKSIAKHIKESRLPIDPVKYVDGLNPFLMDAVSGWCDGQKFADIMKLTTCYEGTIIRVMRRLEELLRQYASAAKAIGNEILFEKFVSCLKLLKRDIVFAASLYL